MKKSNIEEVLKKEKVLIYPVKGYSMLPLLIQEEDKVVIEPQEDYDKYDVVLFRSGKSSYILHRVLKKEEDKYIILGDNSNKIDILSKKDILGKMTGYYKKDVFISIHSKEYIEYLNDLIRRKDSFFDKYIELKQAYLDMRFRYIVSTTYKVIFNKDITIEKSLLESLSYDEVYRLVEFFSNRKALHLFAIASKDVNLTIPKEMKNLISSSLEMVKLRYLRISECEEELSRLLNDNQIPFMFLKGSEIRNYYPTPYLRSSNDIDFYVSPCDFDKALKLIKDKMGGIPSEEYHAFHKGINIEKHKLHIEMHHHINYHMIDEFKYVLEDPFEDSISDSKYPYRKHMCIEKTYLFSIIHSASHIILGANWISMFSDTYLLNKKFDIDKSILKEVRIDEFEHSFLNISSSYFTDIDLSISEKKLIKYLYSSSETSYIARIKNRRKSKFSYFMFRIFPSREIMYATYKVTYKHKILLPFFYVIRWFNLFKKGKLSSSIKEVDRYNHLENDLKDALISNGLKEYIHYS